MVGRERRDLLVGAQRSGQFSGVVVSGCSWGRRDLFTLAAVRLWPVPLLIIGAVLLTGAALVGVLSIGLLLVPGVLAAVAALGPTRGPHGGQPRPSRPRAGMPTG